ncbi:phosphatidylinositol 4-kinase gamma 2-like [Euphorbia lathyris]|uniref:phosphatidylinositol 4-kinase gamma 2-like n=1 Tax=Euphorbia lathyris TaxID=212925 RepID=UPI0033137D5E
MKMSQIPSRETKPPFRTTRAFIQKHFDEFLPIYPLFVDSGDRFGPEISNMIHQSYDGLKDGLHPPELVSAGIGGTYYLRDTSGDPVSVFKPLDEEANSANNPKGYDFVYSTADMITAGGGAAREIAAYYLDHPIGRRRVGLTGDQVLGFSGVPPTVLAHCLHPNFTYSNGYAYAMENYKKGSLQMYMKNDGHFGKKKKEEEEDDKEEEEEEEDEVPTGLSMEEVHKISVLDIRMVNLDRHGGNLLYKKKEDGTLELIPIDHGYCFPKTFDDCCIFKWLKWPDARRPYSDEVIKYIESLKVVEDIAYLRKFGFTIPDKCIRVFHISTMLLKKGATKKLSPFQIGSLMCKETENVETSSIKKIVDEAQAEADGLPNTSEEDFLNIVYRITEARLDEIPPPTT